MSERKLTCADCDELFGAYLEGDLDDVRCAAVEVHASECARCQGLIRDLRSISESAAALPDISPSRDLWNGIEERIQPPVIAIGDRRDGIHLSRRVIGIAAAALVVISSSITYVATNGSPARVSKKPVRVVEAPRDIPVPGASDEISAPSPSVSLPAAPETDKATEQSVPRQQQVAPKRPSLGSSGTSPSALLASAQRPVTAAEKAIAPEIEQLQALLRQRRSQLDPATVKVVEDNLALIDAAVAQAKQALLRDPASGFLTRQLDNVLQKKVELLRTVASLPSRS